VTSPGPSRCGGCTQCCKLIPVEVLNKPANTWCTHCDIGVGCTIYEDRPDACHDYPCLWNMQHSLPDDLRPDRTHVIFESLRHSRTVLAIVDPDFPDAWCDERPMWLISKLIGEGVGVVVSCDGRRKPTVFAPEGRTTKQVWEDVVAEHEMREVTR